MQKENPVIKNYIISPEKVIINENTLHKNISNIYATNPNDIYQKINK
ncbi:hypothetical protein J6R97_07775 [bacterium]|nr:hypothetical protein [bacterium]